MKEYKIVELKLGLRNRVQNFEDLLNIKTGILVFGVTLLLLR